jgi:hypothetical protein
MSKKERLTKKQLARIDKPDLLFEQVDLSVQKKPGKGQVVKPDQVVVPKYEKPKEEERKYGEFR